MVKQDLRDLVIQDPSDRDILGAILSRVCPKISLEHEHVRNNPCVVGARGKHRPDPPARPSRRRHSWRVLRASDGRAARRRDWTSLLKAASQFVKSSNFPTRRIMQEPCVELELRGLKRALVVKGKPRKRRERVLIVKG